VFFKPIRGYTRFQRITVTFSILFGSMCGTGGRAQCRVTRQCCNCSLPAFDINCLGVSANALFYQFGEENARLSVIESLATRLIVGVLSSLVVFVPTTIIGILFKHTRPRTFVGKHFDEYTADDLDSMKIDVRLCLARQIASTNWLTRLPFMFFYCCWWCSRKRTLPSATGSSVCSWTGTCRGGWPSCSTASSRRAGSCASTPRSCTASSLKTRRYGRVTGKRGLHLYGC